MTPKDFFMKFYADAQKAKGNTGVLACVTLAQAALESGWGEHAPGNNFFGMKAGNWAGLTQTLHTWECGSDKDAFPNAVEIYAPGDNAHPQICIGKWAFKINSEFRAYNTPAESFEDHGAFLKNLPRYAPCFGGDYKQFATELQKCGYSTSPTYATELIEIIETHKLFTLDEN